MTTQPSAPSPAGSGVAAMASESLRHLAQHQLLVVVGEQEDGAGVGAQGRLGHLSAPVTAVSISTTEAMVGLPGPLGPLGAAGRGARGQQPVLPGLLLDLARAAGPPPPARRAGWPASRPASTPW